MIFVKEKRKGIVISNEEKLIELKKSLKQKKIDYTKQIEGMQMLMKNIDELNELLDKVKVDLEDVV